MLSYKRIRKISEMFDDSSTQINMNFNDQFNFDADMDWKYEALNFPASEFSIESQFDFGLDIFDEPLSPQSQIRNHDCMWSGRCTTHPNECLNSRNNCNKNKLAAIQQTASTSQQKQQQSHNASLLQKQQKSIQQKNKHNIPAGQSLLRQIKPIAIHVPKITTNDFLNNRDFIARPDTPLSLDDDVPEFKHNIDLAACTVGSNRMSLIEDSPTEIINILKEHLEDTSSNRTPQVTGYIRADADDLDEIINDIKSLPDFENQSEDEEITDESDATNDSFSANNTMASIPPQQIQPTTIKNTITAYEITQSMHSDHSYTRNKNRVDVIGLGVQTPSDSEEEIDVVSVGDKNLPTNPSARDRRALQNKITSRMVKTTTTGSHTIDRRRISNGSSDDSAYASKGSPEIASPNVVGSPIRLVASRKRVSPPTPVAQIPTAKRSKVCKKVTPSPTNGRNASTSNGGGSGGSGASKRNQTVDNGEELGTIEKRNLHNDMERQRRIGLKNLFENLKDKIPSLCEKERAPKVNILREATILCSRLAHEDEDYDHQIRRRHRLQQRLKYLREQMAARGMY
ncbi:myc protein [Contarinia nasturtii]|uniref:myc protein n=1 Tax=Contarinia nasturtii TaxID=265458 RepID=UPI0012D416D1|nr:myc protein [Contarinia nasturtii]